MNKDLYQKTKDIWIAEKCAALSVRWAEELQCALVISKKLMRFHQWWPLKVYSSLSNAKKTRPVFSLRYRGQEVGEIIGGDKPFFNITLTCETNNRKSFGLITKSTKFDKPKPLWNGSEASKFRKQFKDFDSKFKVEKMKSDEAWLQAIVFETMFNNPDAGYHACQPVLFHRFPFQCPVPISANKGVPKKSRGNIDILARRGQGDLPPKKWT